MPTILRLVPGDQLTAAIVKSGAKACPVTYLYWDFLAPHRSRLARNPRMAPMYRVLDLMSEARREEIARDADAVLGALS